MADGPQTAPGLVALAHRRMGRGESAVEPSVGANRSQRGASLVLAEKVNVEVARDDHILLGAGQRDKLRE
eukprot:1461536-Alexandrium_andersonii.AAC.1